MKDINLQILLYLKAVKLFLSNNDSARDYLLVDTNPDYFYELITKMSEENLEKKGEPNLTPEQFEIIREILNNGTNVFRYFSLNGMEKLSLN